MHSSGFKQAAAPSSAIQTGSDTLPQMANSKKVGSSLKEKVTAT
jgi:hypothetical protein